MGTSPPSSWVKAALERLHLTRDLAGGDYHKHISRVPTITMIPPIHLDVGVVTSVVAAQWVLN
jgi:hypothetical protein